MAAVLPKPHLEVVDELISGAPQAGEDEELVDLNTGGEDDAPATPAKPTGAATAPAAAPAAPADEDAEIPEQYRGKSRKDLAKMLHDSQQLIGRQGSELGDFRKHADLLIKSNLAVLAAGRQPQPAPAAPATPADPAEVATEFFRDPQGAVAKAIAEHPAIKKIHETLGAEAAARETSRAQAASERFYTAHPDAGEIMADPEFVGWVKASRIRSQLIQRAHNNFDFDAGDELFGTWKALKGVGKPTPGASAAGATQAGEVSDAARTLAAARKKQALNDAATPTGGSAGAAGKGGAKKIFRRADVLKLMEENPERYEALAPEIEKAYAEGRVR